MTKPGFALSLGITRRHGVLTHARNFPKASTVSLIELTGPLDEKVVVNSGNIISLRECSDDPFMKTKVRFVGDTLAYCKESPTEVAALIANNGKPDALAILENTLNP